MSTTTTTTSISYNPTITTSTHQSIIGQTTPKTSQLLKQSSLDNVMFGFNHNPRLNPLLSQHHSNQQTQKFLISQKQLDSPSKSKQVNQI